MSRFVKCFARGIAKIPSSPYTCLKQYKKMCHRVKVLERNRLYLSFIWREPGSQDLPATYCMNVHIFGAVSSPSSCQFVLNRTAEENRNSYPDVASLVNTSFYVDNFLHSFQDEEDAIGCCQRLYGMLARGGFHLTKWLSSSRSVMSGIAAKERIDPTLDLDLDPLPTEKTLGVYWDSERDAFLFKVQTLPGASTKRQILSSTACIYDPLGFLAPVILSAKMLLQEIWKEDFGWDEPLPERLLKDWKNWSESLENLPDLRIPRCFNGDVLRPRNRQLHVYCDALEKGFGAVIYMRVTDERDVYVSFVMSKARVAPTKFLTIPRLELQGAVVGVRLAGSACTSLGISMTNVTFWTDSTTVLQWIRSQKCRYQTFVANRVGEILEATTNQQWRHVPGKLNPTDICSRGISAGDLSSDHLWFNGPVFLRDPEHLWPENVNVGETKVEIVQRVSSYVGAIQIGQSKQQEKLEFITAFLNRQSSWCRAVRVFAWMRRLSLFLRRPKESTEKKVLSTEEISGASNAIIAIVQQAMFFEEIIAIKALNPIRSSSPLLTVSPFLDSKGILRVGGRLGRSTLSFNVKHPIILPRKHRLTRLIILHCHWLWWHSSTERTLAQFRQLFWAMGGRTVIKAALYRCFDCRKRQVKPCVPQMAALPIGRLEPFNSPLTHTGLDFFDPILVVLHRQNHKRYVYLFICLTTRAVHLEAAHSLDKSRSLSVRIPTLT